MTAPNSINDKFLFYDIETDFAAIRAALENKQLSGTSHTIEEYGVALAATFGTPFALPVSSGSAALHTALFVLGVGPGSDVLVPATAPIPSLLPILTAGANLVFVDTN